MRVPLVAVVDDDASARRSLTRLLQSAELRVLTYTSATEFLATWITSPPDCGILDMHAGGMSGPELVSQLGGSGYTVPTVAGMKMVEHQAGLGFGVKKFNLIWVFETPETLGTFVNSGWDLGGQTSVGAKAGETGAALQGALPVSPGIWVYQLTENGVALELTAKGTKYYKNDDLTGLATIRDLVAVGIILDVLAQFLMFQQVHPGAALLIGPLLITAPYAFTRAVTNRLARLIGRRALP